MTVEQQKRRPVKSAISIDYNQFNSLIIRKLLAGERSKFQLAEKDLKATMDLVLGALNDEYQAYKDEHPNNRFFRKGTMAYYYNGDYYDIDILPDGQIGSFYKRIDE